MPKAQSEEVRGGGSDPLDEVLRQLEHFLDERSWVRPAGSQWLQTPLMEVYVRRNRRVLPEGGFFMLDIANVSVTVRGQGTYSRFLERVEAMLPLEGIFLENVYDDRLVRYYLRRGYRTSPAGPWPFDFPRLRSWSGYRLWNPAGTCGTAADPS
jgi:hypothetical protein